MHRLPHRASCLGGQIVPAQQEGPRSEEPRLGGALRGGVTASPTRSIRAHFQDSNDDGIGELAGIRRRLDHLVTLGVDAVWILPFYPSPMADFGYDVTD